MLDGAYAVVVLSQDITYHIFMNFEEKIYSDLGKNIRKYRIAKGLSQEKLSELLETNSKFIGHIERVERYISLRKLIQLSQILDVQLKQLFDFGEQ